MRQEDRRKELGKMLLDVSKFMVTVGLVGGILTDKLTVFLGATFFVVSILMAIIGYFIIPAKEESE